MKGDFEWLSGVLSLLQETKYKLRFSFLSSIMTKGSKRDVKAVKEVSYENFAESDGLRFFEISTGI